MVMQFSKQFRRWLNSSMAALAEGRAAIASPAVAGGSLTKFGRRQCGAAAAFLIDLPSGDTVIRPREVC
jgi:hypothetical protein